MAIIPRFKDSPETPLTADALNLIVDNLNNLLDNRSEVGDIICSKTLDTMDKVIKRFGGTTWELQVDTFLLGAGGKYEVGDVGGEEEVVLTIDTMPNHRHEGLEYLLNGGKLTLNSGSSSYRVEYTSNGGKGTDEIVTTYTGGDQPHNNMPPYKAVYIWERTE